MQRGVLYCPSSNGICAPKDIRLFFMVPQSSIIPTMDRRRICVSLSCIPLNPGFPRSSCTCTRAGNCRWTLWLWLCAACRRRRSFLPPSRIFVGIPPGDFPGGRRTSMPRSKASRRIPGRCGRWQRGRRTTTTDHGILLVALDGFQT